MYQMMQASHKDQKQEEAIRLSAYREILGSLTSHGYFWFNSTAMNFNKGHIDHIML